MGRPYASAGDDDVFADKYEASPAPQRADDYAQPRPYSYGRPGVLAQQDQGAMSRPSVDAYGAFDGDMPGARGEPSRTMQMAYNDPCEWQASRRCLCAEALEFIASAPPGSALTRRRRRACPGDGGRRLWPSNAPAAADGLPPALAGARAARLPRLLGGTAATLVCLAYQLSLCNAHCGTL